jgi:hypothetical protein
MSNSNPVTPSLFRNAVLAAICVSAAAGVARAQTTDRPSSEMFGRVPSHGPQQLDVSIFTLGAYDDNVVAAANDGGVGDPRTQIGGVYDGLAAQTRYARRARRFTFAASESSVFRYYPSLRDITGLQHAASLGVNGTFGGTQLALNQTFTYSPYYSYTPLPTPIETQPGILPTPSTDSIVAPMSARTVTSSVDLSHPLGKRTQVRFAANYQDTEFNDNTGLQVKAISGHVQRNVTSSFGINAGYGLQQGLYRVNPGSTELTTFYNLDLGIDYHKALSRTRRTKLSFSTGSTMVKGASGSSEYRIIGDARLSREIGRTWEAAGVYHRGVGLIEGFGEPFFQDALAITAGGAINSRVDVSAIGGYSRGQLGLSTAGNNNDSYSASTRVRFAVSRTLALSAEYYRYQYHFDDPAGLPIGMFPHLRRMGLKFGLDLWLPLIH